MLPSPWSRCWPSPTGPALAPIAPPAAASFSADAGRDRRDAGRRRQLHQLPHRAGRAGQCRRQGDPHAGRPLLFAQPHARPRDRHRHAGRRRPSRARCARACRATAAISSRCSPTPHYSQLTDADIKALYAYFMTRPPVKAPNRPNTILFPLDIRPLQAVWKALFFKPGPYRPDPGHDAHWNRGAYLAEAVAACADCHTDRNGVGAEQVGHPYAGALIEGWYATSLDISPSPARWTEDEFFAFLRRGESPPHGVAMGPMRAVVRGLARLPDEDLRAMATYFISLNRPSGRAPEPDIARALSPSPARQRRAQARRGALSRELRRLPRRAGPAADRRPFADRLERGAVEPVPAVQSPAGHARRHRRPRRPAGRDAEPSATSSATTISSRSRATCARPTPRCRNGACSRRPTTQASAERSAIAALSLL